MNIKEKIGERITLSRKALGITIKELAARTGELSAARISNWEQGTRSPGPMEAKQLADVLEVSASYLLCLTDNPGGEISSSSNAMQLVPVISVSNAHLVKDTIEANTLNEDRAKMLMVDNAFTKKHSEHLFACTVEDNSMEPEFQKSEIIIVDADRKPNPGDYVLAYIPSKEICIFRQYSESAPNHSLYQLLALNEHWPIQEVKSPQDACILGTLIEHRRFL